MERLPGFRDFFPEPLPGKDVWSADARNYVFATWRETAVKYGFREYDGPPLELLELYKAKSGEEIVGQLYSFVDKGNREVSMRPEMTPSLARMVAAGHRNYKKPMKWFAIPQLFRYERQQKGRLREHFQFNADIFGEIDPAVDAELICLLIDTLRSLGLTSNDFVIRLSSREAWQQFFSKHCSDETLAYDFFQIIDKLDRTPAEVSSEKLSTLGFAMEHVNAFIDAGEPTESLQRVLDNVSARGLGEFVKVDYQVIRGLAYYTGIVFEAFDRKGEFRAIAGGGRYDNLVKLVSGGKVDIPAIGFGMGDVVLVELLKSRNLLPEFGDALEVFFLIEDESLRNASLQMIQNLREGGISVDYSFVPMKSDKQFKRAQDLKAKFSAIVISVENETPVVRLKNLSTRGHEDLRIDDAHEFIQRHR